MNVVTMQYIRAMEFLRTLRNHEEGQGLVEYALILVLVSVGLVLVLGNLKTGIEGVFNEVIDAL